MITTEMPDDWRALQNQVAIILRECGFTVEVEKTLDSARGHVELDVYAEEMVKQRKYIVERRAEPGRGGRSYGQYGESSFAAPDLPGMVFSWPE
jgi:hypothetical protein